MLKQLFNEGTINGKKVKNRCVSPALVVNYCNEDGTCTERFASYHETKAKGGFGMIVTEDFAVAPRGKGFSFIPGLWQDKQIEGFKNLTERVHKHGALIIAQLYHAGRQTTSKITGEIPLAPSAIPDPLGGEMPEEMTEQQIKEAISQFGDSAKRAKAAGFDGIEIHGAHGYLIAQFMSPYSNKRTDIYGGPLQNRIRFALEVIRNIREKCGNSFIVGYRISADEFVTGGRTIEDTKTIIPYLEEAGVNYFHVTVGVYKSLDTVMPSMYCPHGWISDFAAQVKQITKLPVISVGRYNDPRIAENVIASGKADFVSFGRQGLADPETPNKAKEGRFDDIRTCIGCLHGCLGNLLKNIPGECILNPTLGLESEIKEIKTDTPKKIMVIGAGPGGLETAISAAKCGHKVTVYEKNKQAGGQFRLGSVPAGKGEITTFIRWQMHELEKLNVAVNFNTEVTLELVEQEAPDIIIAATGAQPVIPKIPGADNKLVVTSHDVLSGKSNTGNKIVVIGGGCVGAETANYLASNFKEVSIVEMRSDIALDEVAVPRQGLLTDLKKNNVKIYTETSVTEIKDHSVVLSGKTKGEIPADTVVMSVGSRPYNSFANKLIEKGYNVKIIGDAEKVGLASSAIKQGFWLGREL